MVASAETPEDTGGKGKGLKRLLIGLVGAIFLGGAGFYAIWSGLLALPVSHAPPVEATSTGDKAVFVRLDPIVVTLRGRGRLRQLRVQVQLDVVPDAQAYVDEVSPRVIDALNTFLRAVDERDLAEPTAFPRIKAQMLRRAQIVVGKERIKDLLVTEFIMN